MALPISLVLIAAGAMLVWGVHTSVAGVDLDVIGVIGLVVGVIGIVLALLVSAPRNARARRRDSVVER